MAAVDRLGAPLPKIGIRPTIDGRYGGVRESLEGFTRTLAEAAKALLEKNLRHAGGEPVEVVIASSAIGGATEAAACAAEFAREGVGATLTVTPCWCYGSETMELDDRMPHAVWGFNGTDRPGAVYLAAVLAGHNAVGLPAFGIYGRDVQDLGDAEIPADVAEKILRWGRAALAVATMRGKSYLAMGGTSMGIAGSIVDADFFRRTLGMRVVATDMTEFIGRMEKGIYDHEELDRALVWVRETLKEGPDLNPEGKSRTSEQKAEDWEISVKMALIARDMMNGNPALAESGFVEQSRGHHAIAGGFQGQRQWTDHRPNGDFMEAILNSSFDWNGVRQPTILATENDALNAVCMLVGHLLTGAPMLFSDVRTYWSPDAIRRVTGHDVPSGLLHLINSGPSALDWSAAHGSVKPWWEVTEEDTKKLVEATEFCASMTEYFPGGGWSTDFTTAGDLDVTMFRINLVHGLGPVLQIAEGRTVSLPDEVHEKLDARTNPTWPTTWFVPNLCDAPAFRDPYALMAHWGANHGAIAPGRIGADLISLAAMLRIPVEFHNVPEGEVFRPTAWMRHGSGMDPVGADFRACATYGPLYG